MFFAFPVGCGLFYIIIANFTSTVHTIEKGVSVTVFFDKGLSEEEMKGIGDQISKRAEVSKMKYVGAIRKELGIRTVFNILGPLTNPARPKTMLLGVYDEALLEPLANVLIDLGVTRGMCFTNHFLQGSTAIDKTLPWEDKVRAYWNAYLRVKDWAKDKDFDILFGLEHHYGSGKEVLTYGIDLDFLLTHPNIDVAPIKDYCDAVHEAGGFISQAHPFRRAPYIDPNVLPQPELLDAAEIYNAGNSDEDNSRGYDFAKRNHLYGTSGGDTHEQHESNIGKAGMAFPYRIKTEKELANALFRHDGRCIINGVIQPAEPPKPSFYHFAF